MPSPQAERIVADANATLATLLARADAHSEAALGDAYLGRRVADILGHLHSWHVIFDGWIAQDRAGSVPAYPAEGYTWRDLDTLNQTLYEAHRSKSYDTLRAMLVASHEAATALVESLSTTELTQPDAFEWLGQEPLGNVAHECLGGHYAWALGVLDTAGVA
jgi:hypothetical protein